MHHETRSAARLVAGTGLLGALALVLSLLESALPPVTTLPPGAKLGLSNIAVLYAVQCLGGFPAVCVALVKGVFAGLTRGGAAFIMSTSGGLLSTAVMTLLSRSKRPSFGLLGLGVAGGVAHNLGQLLAACLITTQAAVWYAPLLIGFGVLFGAVTGIILRVTMPAIKRLLPPPAGTTAGGSDLPPQPGKGRGEGK